MLIHRLKSPPLKYVSININDIANTDLTSYYNACELLKKFVEFFVELNELTRDKRIMILDRNISIEVVENTTEFTFPEDYLEKVMMIANLVNTIDYAKKFENIEDAIEFWRKYAKFDDEIIPLLYNTKSIIKLISSDVCYMINF